MRRRGEQVTTHLTDRIRGIGVIQSCWLVNHKACYYYGILWTDGSSSWTLESDLN